MSVSSDLPRNCEVDWDRFDPEIYRRKNYRPLHDEDRKIIPLVRDFFAEAGVADARGVDVGAGPNLYPALSMLPFCRQIELLEFARPNVAWLESEIPSYHEAWDPFWAILNDNPRYAAIDDPRAALKARATVRRESIFDLPRNTWDIGTMFFVACSLSAHIDEFRIATESFVHALKPGAPFAAAFMRQSEGYPVRDAWFPAVSISEQDVREVLDPVTYDGLKVVPIDSDTPIRPGYKGMVLALGRASG